MRKAFFSTAFACLGLMLPGLSPDVSLFANGTNDDPASLGIKPVEERKDPKTGFVIGGRNATATIQALTEINGRTVAELEYDMRPGADSEVASEKGFLGPEESLRDVLAEDNRTVVEAAGVTHQELATHLRVLAALGEKTPDREFRYHAQRFRVTLQYSRGYQLSPFRDGTRTNAVATVRNMTNGKEITYSLLVPDMIERYGFYEGKRTPYRVEPRKVLEVLSLPAKKSP